MQALIEKLNLQPHPEGGYYRETYRDEKRFFPGPPFEGERNYSTAIYFLIEKNNFSAFHKILSDEVWHFYEGDALEVIELFEDGTIKCTSLGKNIAAGEIFQYVVRAGTWFASRVKSGGQYALTGCTVAPGFDFADFKMGSRKELVQKFPQHMETIIALTR